MNKIELLKENGVDLDTSLSLLGDMDMYHTILEEFLNGYIERMNKINDYLSKDDMENYSIEVHSLKSDSKYLGFMHLAELAYQQEMASKNKDSESCHKNYLELVKEANRVVDIANQYLNKDIDHSNITMISSEEVKMASKKILVADDSEIIRDFVKEIFKEKFEVLMASNGKEVINIVSSHNDIVAVLLDLNMPDMDGFQVLEYFKDNNLFKRIPVSIISGANDKESIEKAFTYGIVDMINKPFNKENVKLIVEKMLSVSSNV